jgi:hypothetical protein
MQVREPSMQSSEQKQSPEPLGKRSKAVSRSLPPAALNDVIGPEHRWVSAKTLAALFELDEKWLEDARGGRKEVDGSPFQKLGNADNSPVRYNWALALDWMRRFPTVVNTAGKTFAQFQSVGDFLRLRSFTEPWLFGWHGNELLDVVELLNRDLLSDDDSVSLGWLTFPEWVFLSQGDIRFGGALQVVIDQLAGHALALHEDRLITRIAEAPESDVIKAARDSGTI